MRRRLFPFLGLLLLVLSPARSVAQESDAPLPSNEQLRWSVAAGAGLQVHVNRGRSHERLILFEPAANVRLGPRLEYAIEGHFAQFVRPGGYMLGLMPVGARYYFGHGRTLPYFSIGAGLGWTDLVPLDEIDRRFNFLLQGSAGVRHAVAAGGEWTAEMRWDHISNAGTEKPNLGLNSVIFLLGWRFR